MFGENAFPALGGLMKTDQKKMPAQPVQGRIVDGANASAFSSCGNTRKTAIRPAPGKKQG